MFDRLKAIEARFAELAEEMAQPAAAADRERWTELTKEHARLAPIVEAYDAYRAKVAALDEARTLAETEQDPEFRALAKEEADAIEAELPARLDALKLLLLPPDPDDDRNVIVEIRAGAGGEEASLFGAELMRMYKMYAALHRLRVEDVSLNLTELGGVKEVVFLVSGERAFAAMKYESGVHRVQRVPTTETQGRIHTSTVTVAVLPEITDVKVEIDEKDLRIDTYRSSGAGGQHVNKTESAIRITHIPTGIVVSCQDERSQIKNRERAMTILRSRLYDLRRTQANESYAAARRGQVGTGDRSERIRTYNFPQGRVTDHRIGLTLYSLDAFLNGDLDEMIEALRLADMTERLRAEGL